MTSRRRMMGVLRHPAYLPTIGALLVVYGLVGANLPAILAALCCFYLSWHLRRQHRVGSDDAIERSQVAPYPRSARTIVYVAILAGLVWGGLHAYWRLLDLGWGRSSALIASAAISSVVGAVLWLVVAAIGRPRV